MAEALLTTADLGVNLGDRWLMRHIDATVTTGDRLCLVGRNGAGKSTLMRFMAGLTDADEGSLWVAPGASVSYLPQSPVLPAGMTISSIVQHGTGSDGDTEIPAYQADAMLTRMGMDPALLADGLSGGEARRVALARALVKEPTVLLMDEPTNHLDLPTITWMEELLLGRGGAMVIISHDRAFLRRIGNGVLWLEGGVLRRRQGGFDGFDDWAETIQAEEAVRLHKLDRRIAAETRWSREGITARRKRNQGRLRELETMRGQRAVMAAPMGRNARLETEAQQGGGQLVLEGINLSASVPAQRLAQPANKSANKNASKTNDTEAERRWLFRHWNGIIRKGDRIGIIGANGIGKSTLVRVLLGQLEPDQGRVREGFGVLPAYFDQQRTSLDGEATPWSVLCPGGGDTVEVAGKTKHVKRYLQDFLFDEYKVTQRVRTLSGGEQNRLLLARIFAEQHNLLVLDEPTNDLDMETLELLQEVVADYEGTVLIISHDRDFIDRTVTSVLAFEGEGRIIAHSGGYSDYLARRIATAERQQKKSAAAKSDKPRQQRQREHTPKLSFREKHALEILPDEINRLEQAVAKAEQTLADSNLFNRDPESFNHIARQLEADRTSLAEKEDQWLELETKREELEGG